MRLIATMMSPKCTVNIPLLYGREGDGDVQILFGRNGRCLFYFLAGEGVGLITAEDEDFIFVQI